jgi:ABC-type transport system substrate-binding protein
VARGVALAAAIAVALLAVSGAGGSGAQTPKRGGTVVVGPFGEPPCLNPVACGFPLYMEKVLEPAFVLSPDFTHRAQLVSDASVTRRQPFTVTFEIHPDAHWSDRVPVSARDFVFTHEAVVGNRKRADQGEHRYVRSVSRLGAKSVRVAENWWLARGS